METVELTTEVFAGILEARVPRLGATNREQNPPLWVDFRSNLAMTGNSYDKATFTDPKNVNEVIVPLYLSGRRVRRISKSTPILPEITLLQTHEKYREAITALSTAARLELLPHCEFLFNVDLVWSDWCHEAIIRGIAFHLAAKNPIPNHYSIAELLNLVTGINMSGFLDTMIPLDEAVLLNLARNMGVQLGFNREDGISFMLRKFEKDSLLKNIYDTRSDYCENADALYRNVLEFCDRTNTKAYFFDEKLQHELQRKLRKSLPTPCPRPEKVVHSTLADAEDVIARKHPGDKHMSAYRCVCKRIHIGHK